MKLAQPAPTMIDAYTAAFPPEVQAMLEQIRMTMLDAHYGRPRMNRSNS